MHAEVRVERDLAARWTPPPEAPACLLLTDANVERALPPALAALPRHVIAPGETSKSWSELERLLLALDAHGLDRDGRLVCCGGGVVTDLGGFAAHLHRRGIAWDALPTSVVGQADAALGGKTAVNLGPSKNGVGAFHPARRVLVDPAFLASLPEAELRAGFAEVIKTALISGEELLARVEALRPDALRDGTPDAREVLARVVEVKLALVEEDPFDHGARQLLNLGHTFGHAFEALGLGAAREGAAPPGAARDAAPRDHAPRHTALRHGEAVGLGLLCAARLADDGGALEARLRALLTRWQLPLRFDGGVAPLMALLTRDKKRRGGALRLVLPRAPGRVVLADDVPPETARAAFDAVLAPA